MPRTLTLCGGQHRLKGLVDRETWGGDLGETTTGAAGRLDLVVGVSRQDIEELGVEPLVNGSVDLVLAVAAREGTAKGSDSGLGKLKETGWVDNDIAKGVAFAAEDVVGVVSHGGDALVVGELDNLGLLDFGCFLGVRELAAGLVMDAFGSFELAIGLLGRDLGLGGGSLDTSNFGSVGVGVGHGQRRSKKEELGARERGKGRKYNSRLLLFVRRKTQERVRVEKAISV